jgi:UPF0755 protein
MKNHWRSYFIVFTIFSLTSSGFAFWVAENYLDSDLPISTSVLIEIRSGSSMRQVTAQLTEKAGLPVPEFFRLWARYQGYDTAIRAGEFMLAPGMSPREAMQHLMYGQTVQYPVVFIEGTMATEALATLWGSPKVQVTLEGRSETEILQAIGSTFSSLEGAFFPDTYYYTAGTTDVAILSRARQRLDQVLEEEWSARKPDLPIATSYEALILASIIEKESGYLNEREQISGVFTRRLQTGMRLQSDPTVIYGIREHYDGNIRRSDLDTTTPYNTYRINGLPPTPIALSGRNAIQAALHPADGTTLYFVSRGDGGHQFSDTLEEHNAAVRQYLLNRTQ